MEVGDKIKVEQRNSSFTGTIKEIGKDFHLVKCNCHGYNIHIHKDRMKKIKPIKRTYSENDPFGEEDWEE